MNRLLEFFHEISRDSHECEVSADSICSVVAIIGLRDRGIPKGEEVRSQEVKSFRHSNRTATALALAVGAPEGVKRGREERLHDPVVRFGQRGYLTSAKLVEDRRLTCEELLEAREVYAL
jgi:hypothetical protein